MSFNSPNIPLRWIILLPFNGGENWEISYLGQGHTLLNGIIRSPDCLAGVFSTTSDVHGPGSLTHENTDFFLKVVPLKKKKKKKTPFYVVLGIWLLAVFCYCLNVCVPQEFPCWYRREGRAFMNQIPVLTKGARESSLAPLPEEDTNEKSVAGKRALCLTMLAPWSQTSHLQSCDK